MERLERKGVSRRNFMKYCATLTATMGLSSVYVSKVASALASAPRPPVIRLSLAVCTGCTESTILTMYPWIDELVLDILSLDYHETIMAPSTWNIGPCDAGDKRGPLEEALMGTPVADPKRPVEILRTVHSFDPCIACGVHVIDTQSNEVYRFEVV